MLFKPAARVLNMSRRHLHVSDRKAVLVDRTTKWGNQQIAGTHGTREEVIHWYEHVHLPAHPELLADLDELIDCDLICHCDPWPCHAGVLLKLAAIRKQEKLNHARSTQ